MSTHRMCGYASKRPVKGALIALLAVAGGGVTAAGARSGPGEESAGASPTTPHTIVAAPTPNFNGDRYGDLAIPTTGENIGRVRDAGAVHVLAGSADGPAVAGNQLWHLGVADVAGAPGDGESFGAALAAGDFDGDTYDELAIGVPGEGVAGRPSAGAVVVLPGEYAATGPGLAAAGSVRWTQDSPGVVDTAESGDGFGSALAAGDFDGDGHDDLAIGVPGETVGGRVGAGAVHVLMGSSGGLTATDDRLWTQDSPFVDGAAEAGDQFGAALAVGDFFDDGRSDLAIGVPGEDVGGVVDAGAVQVIYGYYTGLAVGDLEEFERASASGSPRIEPPYFPPGDQVWHQDARGIPDWNQAGDNFGAGLAAGDFDDDAHGDLAIGVPGEDVGSATDAGSAVVIHGHGGFPTWSRANVVAGLGGVARVWNQATHGVPGVPDPGDGWGEVLAAGDFDGDRFDDLAFGVPAEAVLHDRGAVFAVYGSPTGLSGAGSDSFDFPLVNSNTESAPPRTGRSEESETRFGAWLWPADFDGDWYGDLAVGAPGTNVYGVRRAGWVQVLHGGRRGLTYLPHTWFGEDKHGMLGTAETGDGFGE